MENYQVAFQLRSAFEAARSDDIELMETLTDAVREASYKLDLGHVAFLVREACAFVDRIPASKNRAASLERTQAAINRIEVELKAKGIETQGFDVGSSVPVSSLPVQSGNLL